MYRKFRGADPDKTAMLKARGLWTEPVVETEEIMEEPALDAERDNLPGRPVMKATKAPIKR